MNKQLLERGVSAGPKGLRVARGLGGAVLVVLTATVLAACGGGSGGGDAGSGAAATGDTSGATGPVQSEVPAAASGSVAGMLAWMRSWVGSGNDTAQPLTIGAAKLPTDDAAQPVSVR